MSADPAIAYLMLMTIVSLAVVLVVTVRVLCWLAVRLFVSGRRGLARGIDHAADRSDARHVARMARVYRRRSPADR